MAQFVVRNIENSVKAGLKRRAVRHRRSMEEEVRDILRNAVKDEAEPATGLGTEISSLFADCGLEAEIPEIRGHRLKTPFEE
jgi:plasmid stability protein